MTQPTRTEKVEEAKSSSASSTCSSSNSGKRPAAARPRSRPPPPRSRSSRPTPPRSCRPPPPATRPPQYTEYFEAKPPPPPKGPPAGFDCRNLPPTNKTLPIRSQNSAKNSLKLSPAARTSSQDKNNNENGLDLSSKIRTLSIKDNNGPNLTPATEVLPQDQNNDENSLILSPGTKTSSHDRNNHDVPLFLFDSHCHLDRMYEMRAREHMAANGFVANVIKETDQKAWEEKWLKFLEDHPGEGLEVVEGCVTVFCHPTDFMKENRPRMAGILHDGRVYGAFGVHPLSAHSMDKYTVEEINRCFLDFGDKAVAVGECGLDFHKNRKSKALPACEEMRQVRAMKLQIELAKRLEKPLVLHIRDADDMAFKILQESGLPNDWPIHNHCFGESWGRCERWIKAWPGMKFGLNPDKMSKFLVERIPMDKILLETDAPYFKPREVMTRPDSRYSHPGYVYYCAKQVAEIRKLDIEEVVRINKTNVLQVYDVEVLKDI